LTEEEKLLYNCLIKNNDDALKSIKVQDENVKKNIEKIMIKKQLCNFTLKYDYTNMVNLNNVIEIENNKNMFDNYDILKLVNLCFKKESLKLLRNLLIKYITSKQYVEWLNLKTNNNIYNNGIVTSNNWFNHSFDLESIFPTKTYLERRKNTLLVGRKKLFCFRKEINVFHIIFGLSFLQEFFCFGFH